MFLHATWLSRRRLVTIAMSLLAGTVACAPASENATQRSREPSRIVSLAPSLTEILFALGLGDRVAAITSYCDWPPEARSKPRVGGYANPSVEAILALEPDLVLASPGPGNRDPVLAVERAGRRVEIVPAETLEDAYAAIEQVGRLCGVEERGRALAREVRTRVEAVARANARRARVRALFCVQTDPIVAAGAGTLPIEILEKAGGESIVAEPRYPRIGIETVIAGAPDVILQARMDLASPEAGARPEAEFWKRWPSIPAVRNGRVTVVDFTSAMRAGPRVADAVEMLAQILHPETPADPVQP